LPQALHNMLPSTVSKFVSTIKETSLGYVISANELTFAASQVNNQLMTQPFEVDGLLALTYFVLCFALTSAARWLEQPHHRRAARARLPAGMSAAMIRFASVEKWFGPHQVLAGVSGEVARGEVLTLLGPSGSGKSTLIRTVTRLEAIQAGRVLIDGMDVAGRGVDVNQLRQRVGFVFQAFNLFPHLTAPGNITLGLERLRKLPKAASKERAMAELARVGLANKADAMPARLSGGELTSRNRKSLGDGPADHAVRRADLGARPRDGR